MIIVLFVILTLLHFNALAAHAEFSDGDGAFFSSQQVPFFKTINSSFPSGSTSIENLLKNQIVQTYKPEIYYKYKNQILAKTDIKPIFPTHVSQHVIDPKTKTRWSVLETKVDRVLTYNQKTKAVIEFPIEDIRADPYDTGFALTLKDAYLRQKPSDKSATITTIPSGYKFSVLNYRAGFAQVSYKNYVGYLAVSEIITKFDFATYIFAAGKWNLVRNRNFDFIITTDNKKFHFSEITGLITPDLVGLIASKNQKLPMWSRIETGFKNKTSWIQSRIKNHGLIWWKRLDRTSEKIFTIDELLKKDIASISFHPKDPLRAILSAHGIFMTEDGYHWRELKTFKNFHGPVHYFNDLMIFIGNYRSTDQGKTFENYIQLDKLTAAIEAQLGFLPKRLQVKKIDTLPPYQIKLEIETGSKRIHMQSPLFAQSWVSVRS